MRIIVNHLTRMEPGYICVAGIDIDTSLHVRPVIGGARLSARLLRRHGGPFDLAAVADLSDVRPVGQPPEVEDRQFDPARARHSGELAPDEFWDILRRASHSSLPAIFGESLRPQGQTLAVDLHTGTNSLGCLAPTRASLYVDGLGVLRVALDDAEVQPVLPVTDLRFYEPDSRTIRRDHVRAHAERMRRGVPYF